MDRPPRIEHHRRDQRQLQPVVEQELRQPRQLQEAVRHGREQHWRGQQRADDHPTGQVGDLSLALGRLGVYVVSTSFGIRAI